jgi:hypothetical protein
MHRMSDDVRLCVDECLRCYQACFGSAMGHCLEAGGDHVEPQHFRLMMACAETCRATAHVMLTNSPVHRHLCQACAEICEQCAHNCDRLADMQECAEACRRCASCCWKTAEL